MKLDKFDKIDKFGLQLLLAFCFGVLVIVASYAVSAESRIGWFEKPVQCSDVQTVNNLMDDRNQTPLFAGVGTARIENSKAALPTFIFVDLEIGSWHVVEYNLDGDQACVIAVGDQLDFEAVDWFYKKNDET